MSFSLFRGFVEHKKTGIDRFKYKEFYSYLAKLALIASTSTNLMIGLCFKILIAATLLLATALFLLSLRFSLVTAMSLIIWFAKIAKIDYYQK